MGADGVHSRQYDAESVEQKELCHGEGNRKMGGEVRGESGGTKSNVKVVESGRREGGRVEQHEGCKTAAKRSSLAIPTPSPMVVLSQPIHA